jgi:hypothetical protein
MSTIERIAEMSTIEFTMENAHESYTKAETELLAIMAEAFAEATVMETCSETVGTVTSIYGKLLEDAIVEIAFGPLIRKFSLVHLINNKRLFKFIDEELYEVGSNALQVHNTMTSDYRNISVEIKKAEIASAKKAEADKKAELLYQKQKERAIKDFENRTSTASTVLSTEDDFYYALGWLAKHVGTCTAALPDYLVSAFEKHFGSNVPCRVVDSKHRGPAGYQSQWTWSFKMTLKKPDDIPAILSKHLNQSGNAISDTSFVWDLVSNYGFQFGKKQDVDKIREAIPTQYISYFETGLTA